MYLAILELPIDDMHVDYLLSYLYNGRSVDAFNDNPNVK